MARRRRRAAYQKKKQNKVGMLLVTAVILMLMAMVTVKGSQLRKQLADYQTKVDEWEGKIAEETQRAEDIEEYSKYTQTKKYIEDMAREKLGLVYKNQIVFETEGK